MPNDSTRNTIVCPFYVVGPYRHIFIHAQGTTNELGRVIILASLLRFLMCLPVLGKGHAFAAHEHWNTAGIAFLLANVAVPWLTANAAFHIG